jgi:hemerythrin
MDAIGDEMVIAWSDSYNIGDVEIDEQHKYLFRVVNDFLNAKDKVELTECVIHLYKYTRNHFAYEEELMRRVNFKEYDAHVQMHEQLASRLATLGWHISNDTLDMQELETFIRDWALCHITKADARLANYLKRSIPGGDGA